MAAQSGTQIIVVNQGGGPLSRELVLAVSKTIGGVKYLSPDRSLKAETGIQTIPMPSHSNKGIFSRLWAWGRFTAKAAVVILLDSGHAPLLLISNPPLAPLIGISSYLVQHRRFSLLIYDVYPEALEQLGGMPRRGFLSQLWRKMNGYAMAHAHTVITISEQMASTLAQYLRTDVANNMRVLPTWVDTKWIRPIEKSCNPFARLHNQTDKLTVLYSGNIGRVHDITMLPILARQLLPYPEIHFLIIGDGAGKAALVAGCEQEGLTNVTFLPFQDEATLPFSLATGDVSIVALAQAAEGISMPSKTYYAMAAGSAILGISRAGSDLSNVIQQYGCGVNIEPGSVDLAARALVELLEQPHKLDRYRAASRHAAETAFSNHVVIPKLLAAIGAPCGR